MVTISTHRVVFQGAKRNQEWAFSKLNGFQHDEKHAQTSFQVSNRQKVSGLAYTPDQADSFRARLAMALAIFEGQAEAAIAEIESALASLDVQLLPQEPESPTLGLEKGPAYHLIADEDIASPDGRNELTPDVSTSEATTADEPMTGSSSQARSWLPAAGWYPDPAHRYLHRWWDGSMWTARVGDGERELEDPLPV